MKKHLSLNNRSLIKNIMLFIGFFFLLFFYANTEKINPTDRAIIFNLGINYIDSEYIVSLETNIVEGTEKNSGTKYSIIERSGNSILEAINNAEITTGKVMSLAHCNTILFSKNVIGKSILPALNNLVSKELLPENAYICVTTEDPSEIIKKINETGENIGSALKQVFQKNKKSVNVLAKTVRDYIVNMNSLSKVCVMCELTAKQAKDNTLGESVSMEDNKSKIYFLETENIIAVNKEKSVSFSKEASLAYNAIIGSGVNTVFSVDFNNNIYSVEINKTKGGVDISDKNKISVNLKIEMKGKIVNAEYLENELNFDKISENKLKIIGNLISDKISKGVEELITKINTEEIDIFEIKDTLYRQNGYKYLKENLNTQDYISNCVFSIDVKTNIEIN